MSKRPTDKERLDWLTAHHKEWDEGLYRDGHVVVFDTSHFHDPRKSIDAAMNAEKKAERRGRK